MLTRAFFFSLCCRPLLATGFRKRMHAPTPSEIDLTNHDIPSWTEEKERAGRQETIVLRYQMPKALRLFVVLPCLALPMLARPYYMQPADCSCNMLQWNIMDARTHPDSNGTRLCPKKGRRQNKKKVDFPFAKAASPWCKTTDEMQKRNIQGCCLKKHQSTLSKPYLKQVWIPNASVLPAKQSHIATS